MFGWFDRIPELGLAQGFFSSLASAEDAKRATLYWSISGTADSLFPIRRSLWTARKTKETLKIRKQQLTKRYHKWSQLVWLAWYTNWLKCRVAKAVGLSSHSNLRIWVSLKLKKHQAQFRAMSNGLPAIAQNMREEQHQPNLRISILGGICETSPSFWWSSSAAPVALLR